MLILAILAVVAVPQFVDLRADANRAATGGVAGALASGSALNFATRSVNPANGVAVANCTDVKSTLQGGALPTPPSGTYSITAAPGAVWEAEVNAKEGTVVEAAVPFVFYGTGERSRARGFTLTELVAVMLIVAILAVTATSVFDRRTFDTAAFADQTFAQLAYAQKVAVAARRNVTVSVSGNTISLAMCTDAACTSTVP